MTSGGKGDCWHQRDENGVRMVYLGDSIVLTLDEAEHLAADLRDTVAQARRIEALRQQKEKR